MNLIVHGTFHKTIHVDSEQKTCKSRMQRGSKTRERENQLGEICVEMTMAAWERDQS